MPKEEPKIEVKTVKHTFSFEEREALGGELARAIGRKRNVENELDGVKQDYKAKIADADAKIGVLESNLTNGFEFRQSRCRVVFKPKVREKHYFLESAPKDAEPVLIEEMQPDDFQQKLPVPE